MNARISIPKERIASFCQANGIRWLAIFGSALRSGFGPDSDIDVLVEFEPGQVPGLFNLVRIERELGNILGKKIDLRTPLDLSRHFRQEVMDKAEVQYASE